MKKQNFELKNEQIRAAFDELKRNHPERLERRLAFSWSNWGFGLEPLEESAARLERAGIEYIELAGNHYGPDLGYKVAETLRILGDHGIKVAGVCGMYSPDSELASNRWIHRVTAIEYLKREIAFTAAVGGSYLLVIPGAVGRPTPYDDTEFERSVEAIRVVADLFTEYGVRGAVEPVRSAEVSLLHTVADACAWIEAINHPGIQHITGDVYHMQVEEEHIGAAILEAGDRLINVHLADSNRRALGLGSLDVDTVIRALYVIGFNTEGKYVTAEPLGPGGDPYPAMYGKPDKETLDAMVMQTVRYFREREAEVLAS